MLEDQNSTIYRENVAKFGIPEEYVRKAFSEDTLLDAASSGESIFYLALENKCKILGFAQIAQRGLNMVELDRIVVFPEYARKGVGSLLLAKVVKDQQRKKVRTIIANAGESEAHARRFYEKNGFKLIGEKTVEVPWGKLSLVTYQLQLK
jgi:ribosomal protein S18 acetylase RimI-like enzyme